jgi:hypothetical protein
MDLGSAIPQSLRLDDPRQLRIHERLGRLVGLGPASFFSDACRLMEQTPPYGATTHLVAHLVREVESALRSILEPVAGWSKRDQKEGYKRQVERILAALNIGADEPAAKMWLELAGEQALNKRAHRDSLARPRQVDGDFREFWSKSQAVLDTVLAKIELRFSEYQNLMDQLAAKNAPTTHDIKIVRNNIPNNLATSSYFFRKLRSPKWVRPLRESGVFKEILDPVSTEDGG